HYSELLSHNVTIISGDYWKVWPIVFHFNWKSYENHSDKRLYGLSFRSDDTADEIAYRVHKGNTIALFKEDPLAQDKLMNIKKELSLPEFQETDKSNELIYGNFTTR
ncbi:MAG: hypothetical protein ACRD4L_03640, partial [Pyrinomonadaceae bacterium]